MRTRTQTGGRQSLAAGVDHVTGWFGGKRREGIRALQGNGRRRQRIAALQGMALGMVLLATLASAQSVPPLINYQGRLTGTNGLPLATGDYALEFSLYTTNGACIWGPQVFDGVNTNGPGHGARVSVVDGYFNVVLGPQDTNGASILHAFTNTATLVAVATNGQAVVPKQRILSVPYAVEAYRAQMLANVKWVPLDLSIGDLREQASSPDYTMDLPPEVPTTAREVLIYVMIWTANSGPNNAIRFSIYTTDSDGVYAHYFLCHPYGQAAVSYNSSTFWLPVTAERKVRTHRNTSAVQSNADSDVRVIGYR